MALSAALFNDISLQDSTRTKIVAEGSITVSGSYPTNGDTLDLSKLGIPTDQTLEVEIYEAKPAPGPASGYVFVFLPGTTQANGLMEMFNGTTQVTTQTYANLSLPATFALRFRIWAAAFI